MNKAREIGDAYLKGETQLFGDDLLQRLRSKQHVESIRALQSCHVAAQTRINVPSASTHRHHTHTHTHNTA